MGEGVTATAFLIAYALGLLTAGLWAAAWWMRKRVRLSSLLVGECDTRVRAMKSRTFEEAAVRCEEWLRASERLEREIYS